MNSVLTRIYTGLATGGLATIISYRLIHPDNKAVWVADCDCYATPIHAKPLMGAMVIGLIVFLATTRTMLVINRKGKK